MKAFNKNKAKAQIKINQKKDTYIKKLSISLSCLFLLVCAILLTFAKYETSSDIYTMINGKAVQYLSVYQESLLNGAYPVLTDNLVPVTIDDNGVVRKANLKNEWYKYADKKWANAVILKDKELGKSYKRNQIIPDENIESYFVWIPKYSYKLFDMGTYTSAESQKPTTSNSKTVDIVFGVDNTTQTSNSCITPLESASSRGAGATRDCAVGNYMTHPAFITMNTNGFWVGKFETGGELNDILIKPNISSLTNITISTMFDQAYNYSTSDTSHMMKNTEWGAVAYLAHSIYGINTEPRINNNGDMITGYAATDSSNLSLGYGVEGQSYGTSSTLTMPYNTTTGYKASTTGNITGVYDMTGGAIEATAAYLSGNYGSSGFTSSSNYMQGSYNKYFDVYDSSNPSRTTYYNRILGDATGELGPFYYYKDTDDTNRYHNNWYADRTQFLIPNGPWFIRGGSYSNGYIAGIFSSDWIAGSENNYVTFRMVLSPN